VQVVRFLVCGKNLALSVEAVREVVPAAQPTAVFNAPDHLAGLLNVRGEAVPIFDLSRLFGYYTPDYRHELVVIAESGPYVAGFLGARPVDIVDVPDEVESLPGEASPCLDALSQVLMLEGESVLVLDPEKLFELPAMRSLREEGTPVSL